MKKTICTVIGLLLASNIMAGTTNYESKGNLKSETKIKLKNFSDITNKNNPVDLYTLVKVKVEQEKYAEAADIFIIAAAYGAYDASRVQDPSAHQAATILQMNLAEGLSQKKLDKFQDALDTLFHNPDQVLKILNKVGKPDYYPSYMVQYGMGAFTQNKNWKNPDFDSNKTWNEILDGVNEL